MRPRCYGMDWWYKEAKEPRQYTIVVVYKIDGASEREKSVM